MKTAYYGMLCILPHIVFGQWCGHVWCEHGCCDDHCCPYPTMAIIGTVLGGIVFIATVIVCLLCVCCMCQSNKRHRATTGSIQPVSTNTLYVQNSAYGNPVPNYSLFSAYPSTSADQPPAYSDPANPPGAVNSGVSNDHPSQTLK